VGEVITETIATTPKYTTPHSVHQRIRSAINASQQLTSPMVSYFETSATALCGNVMATHSIWKRKWM
jgi:hypothetical protein